MRLPNNETEGSVLASIPAEGGGLGLTFGFEERVIGPGSPSYENEVMYSFNTFPCPIGAREGLTLVYQNAKPLPPLCSFFTVPSSLISVTPAVGGP